MIRATSITAGLIALGAALTVHAAQTTMTRVDMRAYSSASRTGYAYLVLRPEATDVAVEVARVSGMTLPMHLYTYLHQGSCANLGPRATQAPRRVLSYREASGLYSVRNTLPVGLEALRARAHALAVWSGPADGEQLLYCGDLRLS